jgi:HSP20 family protein
MARKEPKSGTGKSLAERQEWTHPFATLRQEMDRLFDGFFEGRFDRPRFGLTSSDAFVPQVDVVDTDKEVRVSVELPGIDEKDIDVSLTKEALTIRGEKAEEKEEKGKNYYRSERSFGSFSRTIPLPIDIDSSKVSATFKKGVLTVKLPKTKQAIEETRKIAIKAE